MPYLGSTLGLTLLMGIQVISPKNVGGRSGPTPHLPYGGGVGKGGENSPFPPPLTPR